MVKLGEHVRHPAFRNTGRMEDGFAVERGSPEISHARYHFGNLPDEIRSHSPLCNTSRCAYARYLTRRWCTKLHESCLGRLAQQIRHDFCTVMSPFRLLVKHLHTLRNIPQQILFSEWQRRSENRPRWKNRESSESRFA